jgi:VIT1/CCC1 family predicted Fe2+/Mn2+ transporter
LAIGAAVRQTFTRHEEPVMLDTTTGNTYGVIVAGGGGASPQQATSEHSYAVTQTPSSAPHPVGHRHRDVSGGRLRPAVFGAMDGLVTNVSLIAGIGGSGATTHTVVLTGMAGLVAGAFSMATGEYTSVKSQNESVSSEVQVEALELARYPEAETAELAASYESRGVDPDTARRVAEQLSADPHQALSTHSQIELGVNPEQLPSPWTAAASSFIFFSAGALLPLLTYFAGITSLVASLALSAVALFAAGAVTARFTGRKAWFSGLRQLGLGALAAVVTFFVGHLIGAQVS